MNLCIVGTGYVGLVAAACFAEMGNHVTCVDIDPAVVEGLNNGKVHIYEPGLEDLVARNTAQGRLTFTTDLSLGMAEALFVFICVGTPSCEDGRCDLRFVDEVARQIGRTMEKYVVVVDKSTVPVGTADRVRGLIAKELEERGKSLEFDVVSNPEFLKEGDAVNDFLKPDRVIVGTDNVRTAELLKTLYAPFARTRDKLIVMSVRSAEMTKYAANCMLAAKISFINEMAAICEEVGADIRDVRTGIGSDHRIGYQFIYPGPGFGGSCFPKDVRALIATAEDAGVTPELLLAVNRVNVRQKLVLPGKVEMFFQNRGGMKDKTLALWGIAFKAKTDDIRESPALDLIGHLTARGMRVQAYDPEAGARARDIFSGNGLVTICNSAEEALLGADALAVITEWNQFRNPDFDLVRRSLKQPVIFDGRNLYSPRLMEELGFEYLCIGQPRTTSGNDR